MFEAYLDKGDVNVILVDWGEIAIDINYVYVASQVPVVGKAVAESLEKLGEAIDLNTLHVIGHSLGAHIAGHIGRYMNITLSRITGKFSKGSSFHRKVRVEFEGILSKSAFHSKWLAIFLVSPWITR